MKVYVYKMHAGIVGTDETFVTVHKLSERSEWDYVRDHAESFGMEQDEEGIFRDEDGYEMEPEIWLVDVVSSRAQMQEHLGDLLLGNQTEEQFYEKEEITWDS